MYLGDWPVFSLNNAGEGSAIVKFVLTEKLAECIRPKPCAEVSMLSLKWSQSYKKVVRFREQIWLTD